MADLRSMLGGFNAANVEPNTGFEPIPAGEYEVVIVESETKPNKAGTGSYLELQLMVMRGPHERRYLWDRLNLDNPNVKAMEIARATLSAICRAVGVLTPKDSMELHNKLLLACVKLEADKQTGEVRNKVSGYKPLKKAVETPAPRMTTKLMTMTDETESGEVLPF